MTKRNIDPSSKLESIYIYRKSLRKRLRRRSNGCLEYIGPQRGWSKGNPLIRGNNGTGCIHLRRWMWELFFGTLPKGSFVRMKCNNSKCHDPMHMVLLSTHKPYHPLSSQYSVRFSSPELFLILYYGRKLQGVILSKLINIPYPVIYGICNKSEYSNISLSLGWKPPSSLDRKMEEASISLQHGFYLSDPTLQTALKDIRKSSLSDMAKSIVSDIISGRKVPMIAKANHLSNSGVWHIFRRSLVSINTTISNPRWIRIASKDRIKLWVMSLPPKNGHLDKP